MVVTPTRVVKRYEVFTITLTASNTTRRQTKRSQKLSNTQQEQDTQQTCRSSWHTKNSFNLFASKHTKPLCLHKNYRYFYKNNALQEHVCFLCPFGLPLVFPRRCPRICRAKQSVAPVDGSLLSSSKQQGYGCLGRKGHSACADLQDYQVAIDHDHCTNRQTSASSHYSHYEASAKASHGIIVAYLRNGPRNVWRDFVIKCLLVLL